MTEGSPIIVASSLVQQAITLTGQIQQYVAAGHPEWRGVLDAARALTDAAARAVREACPEPFDPPKPQERVTRDMALDAGDPNLEGQSL